jgi:hypothetical protein
MQGPLPSYYARLSVSDFLKEQARREQSALAQSRESNKAIRERKSLSSREVAARRAESNSNLPSRSNFVSQNIWSVNVPSRERKTAVNAHYNRKDEFQELDRINEEEHREWRIKEDERQKQQQPVRDIDYFDDTFYQVSRTGKMAKLRAATLAAKEYGYQGGYTKLTKMGLLARIMNIKKKAAKAAKAAKAKAKPVVRKVKRVVKPAVKSAVKRVAKRVVKPAVKRVAKPKRA